MTSILDNKRILVTGACGTVGSELVRQLLHGEYNPGEVVGIDNNESELFNLDQLYLDDSRTQFFFADIRDKREIGRLMQGIDIVFHAAALKHVIVCERSPSQAVSTNVNGVENIIDAAIDNKVGTVVFTSSDKAVNPTNVMGTSKLMGERLMTASNSHKRGEGPVFVSTRFGNILGSRGSVVPVFHNQIAKGGPVTITDNEMTRFVMNCRQAVKLVIDSANFARGGEVFITKMPVLKIELLAKVMIKELAGKYGYDPADIKISIIGTKPGEKLYEELMSDEETRRAVELDDYFSVLPAFRGIYNDIYYSYESLVSEEVHDPYISSSVPFMTEQEISGFLHESDLLDTPAESGTKRYWPGDKESGVKL